MTAATMTGGFAPQAGREERVAGGKPTLASAQVLARWTGVLFIITFVASIPAVFTFYAPALSDPAFVLDGGRDSGIAWGAFLEMIVILANVGTAVALFPIVKRQNEALALGFVTARLVESGFIAVGLLSMLALGTLRLEAAGADADTLVLTGQALVAIHDWTFLLGPGTVVGIGNGLILGYLMFSSGLVPRGMAVLGLIGGPALLAANVGILFGLHEAGSVWQIIATVPEFIWELSFGIWLTVKGFKPAAVAALGFADR